MNILWRVNFTNGTFWRKNYSYQVCTMYNVPIVHPEMLWYISCLSHLDKKSLSWRVLRCLLNVEQNGTVQYIGCSIFSSIVGSLQIIFWPLLLSGFVFGFWLCCGCCWIWSHIEGGRINWWQLFWGNEDSAHSQLRNFLFLLPRYIYLWLLYQFLFCQRKEPLAQMSKVWTWLVQQHWGQK